MRSGHHPHELHQSLCGRDPAASAQRPSVLDWDEVDRDHDFVKFDELPDSVFPTLKWLLDSRRQGNTHLEFEPDFR